MIGRVIELYPYQAEIIRRIEEILASGDVSRICLQAATGAGKTIIAGMLIKLAVARGESVLVIAHTEEIIGQTSLKLVAFGIDHAIIKAGYPMRLHKKVQVASIQTLFARGIRNKKIELPQAVWVFF
jgi:superfamily II DNA or RNA helicase